MRFRSRKAITAALMMAFAVTSSVEPAAANDVRAAAGLVGGILGGILLGVGMSKSKGSSGHTTKRSSGTSEGDKASGSNDRDVALASLGADRNLDGILNAVTLKSVEASAGANESLKIGKKGNVVDNKFDLQAELTEFVKDAQRISANNNNAGEVTRAAVEAALDEIYEAKEQAGLRQYEILRGENWTASQLKCKIVMEARQKIGRYATEGKNTLMTMTQARQILVTSARDVYTKMFELSELVGMSQHIADFDRELYEGGKVVDLYAGGGGTNAVPAGDDDEDGLSGGPSTPSNGARDVSVEVASKMKFITPEMIRIARLLANDVQLDLGREDREFAEAFRYRITRATVDCFIALATDRDTERAPEAAEGSDPASSTVRLNHRYEDLVKTFQAAIARRDRSGPSTAGGDAVNSDDGVCRKEVMRLVGRPDDGAAPAKAGAGAASKNRDLALLKEPQPARAVWTGTGWNVDGVVAKRTN